MDFPRVSVVIPYYNNARTIRRCLLSFANEQSVTPHEIIVVDDGSAQPAADLIAPLSLQTKVKVLLAEHRGQSAASNIGIQHAEADIVLLTCADIVAVRTFVETHVREHALAQQLGQSIGVLGHIAYAPWVPTTPFLQYLSCDGPQFCFESIADRDDVDGALLYSPNCSLRRADLLAIGGFDEGFPYGFQDTDLGLRLCARGVRVVYRPAAWAHHDHPNTLRNYCRRNRSIGHYVGRMGRLYPHLFRRENLKKSLPTVAVNPQLLRELMDTAERFESLFLRRGGCDPQERDRLFSLYAQATEVAFIEGMLDSGDDFADLLGVDRASWRSMCRPDPSERTGPSLERASA